MCLVSQPKYYFFLLHCSRDSEHLLDWTWHTQSPGSSSVDHPMALSTNCKHLTVLPYNRGLPPCNKHDRPLKNDGQLHRCSLAYWKKREEANTPKQECWRLFMVRIFLLGTSQKNYCEHLPPNTMLLRDTHCLEVRSRGIFRVQCGPRLVRASSDHLVILRNETTLF